MSGLILLAVGVVVGASGTVLAAGASAASRLELARWVSERLRGAEIAGALLSAPGRVLGTANALAVFGVVLASFGAAVLPPAAGWMMGAAIFVVIGVPLLIGLCYVLPRAGGRRWAEVVVKAAAPVLDRGAAWFAPIVPQGQRSLRGELAGLLRSDDEGVGKPSELLVIAGVIAFTERPVREVMTPRTEIVALEEGADMRDVATIFADSGYSRLPVYAGSLDNIVGFTYAFDLLKAPENGVLPLRPVTVVPASRPCADLLLEMQRERRQFAVVLDEFGGTAGIVTFEDLLEELVGEIFDEHDRAPAQESTGIDLWEVGGDTPLDDLRARFEVGLPGRTETVAGYLAETSGRIPTSGERVVAGGLEFDVLQAGPTRVDRVIVRRSPVPTMRIP